MNPAPTPARPALTVTHEPQAQRFVVVVDGLSSECVYRRHAEGVDFVHTEVPARLEGRGIAAALVRAALDWARAEGLKVRPRCSYVAAYMRRHPESQDLL